MVSKLHTLTVCKAPTQTQTQILATQLSVLHTKEKIVYFLTSFRELVSVTVKLIAKAYRPRDQSCTARPWPRRA